MPEPGGSNIAIAETAKAEWKRLARYLHDLGIHHDQIEPHLPHTARPMAAGSKPKRKLKETPHLLRTPAGYLQPSPWLAMSNKNVELMHKFMSELGLSPVSRSRVSTTLSLGPKPWEFD